MICPVLLLLAGGIIEGGMLLYTLGNMEHVARQTARFAAIGDMSETEAETWAVDEIGNSIGAPTATAAVTISGDVEDDDPLDDEVEVTITIDDSELNEFLLFGYLVPGQLSRTVTLHREV